MDGVWAETKEIDTSIDAMQSALDDAVSKLAERDAEIERLRPNAGRYLWLRKQNDDNFEFAVVKNPHFDLYESAEELDSAIDAAMSEEVKDRYLIKEIKEN